MIGVPRLSPGFRNRGTHEYFGLRQGGSTRRPHAGLHVVKGPKRRTRSHTDRIRGCVLVHPVAGPAPDSAAATHLGAIRSLPARRGLLFLLVVGAPCSAASICPADARGPPVLGLFLTSAFRCWSRKQPGHPARPRWKLDRHVANSTDAIGSGSRLPQPSLIRSEAASPRYCHPSSDHDLTHPLELGTALRRHAAARSVVLLRWSGPHAALPHRR